MLRNDELAAWDRENFMHPSTHHGQFARGEQAGRIITGGDGVYVTDRDGVRLLDGFAGLYCVNVGYGRREIADAIAAQAHELPYYHAYAGNGTEAAVTLAKMVMERAPKHMSRVYFGLGGSDANETNVKLVWYANNVLGRPAKKKIIGRWRGYHGSGLMSGSLTGLDLFHKQFDLPLPPVIHTHAPYYYRRPDRSMSEEQYSAWLADELDRLIVSEGADTVAALIGEPVLGTGGIVPPPKGYWPAIQAVLKKHDVWLIADEVVTGFGRLGTMFGSDFYGMKPDLIAIAKGLTSAYAPLSGSIVSKDLWTIIEQGTDKFGMLAHGWTYSAHPLCAAAGIANLKLIDSLGLPANAATVGPYLTAGLRSAIGSHPNVGEVRGEGLLAAVELVEDREARKFFDPSRKIAMSVSTALMKRGVIGRAMPQSDIVGFAPPLCLSKAEADTIVTAMAGAVKDVLG